MEANRLGIQILQDLSITGFDDLEFSAVSNRPLTTIHTPSRRMGEMTANALIQRIEQGISIKSTLINSELVIRHSSGPADELRVRDNTL